MTLVNDRFPTIPPAGKREPLGDRVKTLFELSPRAITPPVVKKFLNTTRPEAGAIRVFYGKANDPDIASTLVHGKTTNTCLTGGSLINPAPKTRFNLKLQQLNEAGYASHQRAPFGKSHDQSLGLPKWFNINKTTFGVKNYSRINAGEIINPPKTSEQVERDSQEGRQNYIRSHNAYFVGERVDRAYDWKHCGKDTRFGVPTPHYNDGRMVSKSLHWPCDKQKHCSAMFVSKRCDDFRERTQPQISKVHDPIAETLKVPAKHTFGILLRPDDFDQSDHRRHVVSIALHHQRTLVHASGHHPYGLTAVYLGFGVCPPGLPLDDSRDARDLLQALPPSDYLRGKDRQRSLVSVARQHLKKANYRNFNSILEAFRHYDKKGQGKIDKEDLQEVCRQFKLDLSGPLLDSLMEYCDVDKDGHISFLEFANFLSWKDQMPIGRLEQGILTKERTVSTAPANMHREEGQASEAEPLVTPEDLVPVELGSWLKKPKTLTQPRSVPDVFATSSSQIGAVVDGTSTAYMPTLGIPSVRVDLAAPRIKRVSDRTNYGDLATAYDLLYPPLHSQWGVHEEHFFYPRSKDEISAIFRNAGVDVSEETFEEAWRLASTRHPSGEVCVEGFRNTLREIQAN